MCSSDLEVHIIKLIYQIAKRIALKEIKEDPDAIIPVIRKVVDEAQTDETVVIHVSEIDLEIIEKIRKRNHESTEFLKRIRLEPSERVSPGGCWLESNFGTIDATIEKRVEKAWELITEKLPHIANQDVLGQMEENGDESNSDDGGESDSEGGR